MKRERERERERERNTYRVRHVSPNFKDYSISFLSVSISIQMVSTNELCPRRSYLSSEGGGLGLTHDVSLFF